MSHDRRTTLAGTLVAACILAGGCANQANYPANGAPVVTDEPADAVPAGHFALADTAPIPPLTGVVAKHMSSGGYTYAELRIGGKNVWVAGPRTRLAPGDSVTAVSPTVLKNFRNRALGRTFPRIYFTAALVTRGASSHTSAAGVRRGS